MDDDYLGSFVGWIILAIVLLALGWWIADDGYQVGWVLVAPALWASWRAVAPRGDEW